LAIDALAPLDRVQVAEEDVEEAGLRMSAQERLEGRNRII
jgi:hypothetical protein